MAAIELTLKLVTSALPIELVLRRYWNMADDTLDRPEKMTIPMEISMCFRILAQDVLTSEEHLPRLEVEEIQDVPTSTQFSKERSIAHAMA
jgi:hypothetical protein